MHVLKNKIVLALLVGVFAIVAGCAGSSQGSAGESAETAAVRDAKVKAQESQKLVMLEEMYELFKSSVRNRAPSDILLDFLTDPSTKLMPSCFTGSMNVNTCGPCRITACFTCCFTIAAFWTWPIM